MKVIPADEELLYNPEICKALDRLRDAGWAVICWHPDELGDADVKVVETRSIEFGWEVIADLNRFEEGDEEEEEDNDVD